MQKELCVVGMMLIMYSCSDENSEGNLYLKQVYSIKKASSVKEFDGVIEPDIPVENDSLLGVDNNKNGVRDDVEIWINRSGDTYNKRMSLRQYAADFQYLLSSADKDDVNLISHAYSVIYSSSRCVTYVYDGREGIDILKKLDKIAINTRKRQKALENINKYNFVYSTVIKDLSITEDYKNCNFKLKK